MGGCHILSHTSLPWLAPRSCPCWPVHWAARSRCTLLLTLTQQAGYWFLLVLIPLPVLAVEGYEVDGSDKLGGLFQDSLVHCLPCSHSTVQCLTWTPAPSCVLSLNSLS